MNICLSCLRHLKPKKYPVLQLSIHMPQATQNAASPVGKLYQVEKIFDRKMDKTSERYFYKIKWLGYPETQATWQPLNNLIEDEDVVKMVQNFNRDYDVKTKAKPKWSGGLKNWAHPPIVDQNVNNDNIDDKRQENKKFEVIDLETTTCEVIDSAKRKDSNPFISSKVKKKFTKAFLETYPFHQQVQASTISQQSPPKIHCMYKKPQQILKIQSSEEKDETAMCLVRWKSTDSKQSKEEWVLKDHMRLLDPQMLVNFYEKLYAQKQRTNKN